MLQTYLSLVYHILAYKFSRIINYPLAMPITLTLSITGECYSKCKSCNIWKIHQKNPKNIKEELTAEEWDKIFINIGKSVMWVTFTGGEPFLRRDLIQISNSLIKNIKPKYLNYASSGIYPKLIEENMKKILPMTKEKGIIVTINISVDEIGRKYKKIRGIDGFDKVKKTFFLLKKLKKNYPNLVLGTNIVLSKYNYKRLRRIYFFISEKIKPDSIVVEIGSKRKALSFEEDISISKEDSIKAVDFLLKKTSYNSKNSKLIGFFRKRYYRLLKKHIKLTRQIIKCYAGISSCEISPQGEVWNCCLKGDSFGNLRQYDLNLREIWNDSKAKKIRKKIKDDRCFCNTANPNYTNMLIDFFKI